MRRTKEEAQLTREHILRTALSVFRQKGYTASTLEEIAQQANVTRGAVYGHFQGKPELYQAVIREGFARSGRIFQDLVDEHGMVEQSIRRFMYQSLASVEDDEWYQGVIELTLFKAEPGTEAAGDQAKKQDATSMLADRLAALLRQGIAQQEIRASIDCEAVALTLLASINGAILLWFQSEKTFSLKHFANTLADTHLKGLLVPS